MKGGPKHLNERKGEKPDSDTKITFNGEERKPEKSNRPGVAAADNDRMLNWRDNFPNKEEHSDSDTSGNIKEDQQQAASHDISHYHKVKKKRKSFGTGNKTGSSLSPIIVILKNIWIPLLSAAIVGLGLGFTVLLFFPGDGKTSDTASTFSREQAASAGKDEKSISSSQAEAIPVGKLAMTVNVVQVGAYSTKAQANEKIASLKDKGIPAISYESDNIYVFLGAAMGEGQVDPLKTYYDEAAIDIYIKKWPITAKNPLLKNSSLNSFLLEGKNLLNKLFVLSNGVMISSDPPEDKELKVLNKMKVGWTMAGDEAMKPLSKKEKASLEDFYDKLSGATLELNGLEPKTAKSDISKVQQKLLEAMVLYKTFLTSKG